MNVQFLITAKTVLISLHLVYTRSKIYRCLNAKFLARVYISSASKAQSLIM